MLLQIHDELLFEIKEELVAKTAPIIKEAMESAYPLKSKEEKELLAEQFKTADLPEVPLVVNVEAGNNWEEMSATNKTMFYLLHTKTHTEAGKSSMRWFPILKPRFPIWGFLELREKISTRRNLKN